MRLVRAGRISEDRFVRGLDDAPVPEDVPVLLPAGRLLADARDLVLRPAPTGVIWPNDRKIAELVPYLDWIALVALVFPSFRDGRAYSQARLLRERHEFRGELRATGQVLRDQFLFLHRAGFDAFEVSKEADAAAFAEAIRRYSVFYQPTGNGRPSRLTRPGLRRVASTWPLSVHDRDGLPTPRTDANDPKPSSIDRPRDGQCHAHSG